LKKDEKDFPIWLVFIFIIAIILSFILNDIDNDLPPLQNQIDDSPFEDNGFKIEEEW
jgi:hypothetical protein